MKKVITVETIRSGQPRPYADHEYEYLVSFQIERSYGPEKGSLFPQTKVPLKHATQIAALVCGFYERNSVLCDSRLYRLILS